MKNEEIRLKFCNFAADIRNPDVRYAHADREKTIILLNLLS